MACRCGLASSEEGEEEVCVHSGARSEHSPGSASTAVGPVRSAPPIQSTSTDPQQQAHSHAGSLMGRSALCMVARQAKQIQMSDQSESLADLGPLGVSGTQSDSAISQQKIRKGEKLFYGAHIGSETRNVEFKRGGGAYLRSSFRSHLRRYACAFLNSGGGSLLVGVDDGGIVRGVHCDHKQEDRARLLVDSILKFFRPPLLPHCYSLAFVPVVRPGLDGVHLKVLRLTLRPPPGPSQLGLYQTDQGEVYLRRDGSVEGPLSAAAIQEWARQKWSGEVMRLQQCVEALLIEQRLLLQELRQQCVLITFLQNTHARSRPYSRKPLPPAVRNQLLQTLGRQGSHGGSCNVAPSGSASSVGPAQVGVEWAGLSNVSDCSLPGREGLGLASDGGPGARHGQGRGHRGQGNTTSGSSICCIV